MTSNPTPYEGKKFLSNGERDWYRAAFNFRTLQEEAVRAEYCPPGGLFLLSGTLYHMTGFRERGHIEAAPVKVVRLENGACTLEVDPDMPARSYVVGIGMGVQPVWPAQGPPSSSAAPAMSEALDAALLFQSRLALEGMLR